MLNGKMFLQKKVSGGGLPSAFQEVEWIASSGTQYIDTGVESKGGNHVKAKLMRSTDSQYSYAAPFGTLYRYEGNYYRNCLLVRDNSQDFQVFNYYSHTKQVISANTDFIAEYKSFSGTVWCEIDGTRHWETTQTYSDSATITCYMFGYHNLGISDTAWWYGRIYWAEFFDKNGIKIRDFKPCYRKSDSVIGMYDLVNGEFYTNIGSGTFTKGADVN